MVVQDGNELGARHTVLEVEQQNYFNCTAILHFYLCIYAPHIRF